MKKFASKSNNLPVPASTGRSLQQAKSLLKLTDSVLGGDRSLTSRDAWLDELVAWADENRIPEKVFPRDADAILALRLLNLYGRELSYLPESIGNLTNLEHLYLGNNDLIVLPDSVGDLTNLKVLYLWRNYFSELPDSIGNLANLEVLDLDHNLLSVLPESIGNLTNLKCLHLESNGLVLLPDSIGNLTDLRIFG
ncbi:MAG: leucine-rich repeat domain-containing protein [Gammaproteobacteria bacterium]|nr:leucine-rich repeat domain-containing protein [Gammaproteobacteria bacterium]